MQPEKLTVKMSGQVIIFNCCVHFFLTKSLYKQLTLQHDYSSIVTTPLNAGSLITKRVTCKESLPRFLPWKDPRNESAQILGQPGAYTRI